MYVWFNSFRGNYGEVSLNHPTICREDWFQKKQRNFGRVQTHSAWSTEWWVRRCYQFERFFWTFRVVKCKFCTVVKEEKNGLHSSLNFSQMESFTLVLDFDCNAQKLHETFIAEFIFQINFTRMIFRSCFLSRNSLSTFQIQCTFHVMNTWTVE